MSFAISVVFTTTTIRLANPTTLQSSKLSLELIFVIIIYHRFVKSTAAHNSNRGKETCAIGATFSFALINALLPIKEVNKSHFSYCPLNRGKSIPGHLASTSHFWISTTWIFLTIFDDVFGLSELRVNGQQVEQTSSQILCRLSSLNARNSCFWWRFLFKCNNPYNSFIDDFNESRHWTNVCDIVQLSINITN